MTTTYKEYSPRELARFIQHTFIEEGITREQLIKHCEECLAYGFNAAMIPGSWVPLASEILRSTNVLVASAVDFPLGTMSTRGKVAEALALVEAGAHQLDIGVQIGWLRSGMLDEFRADIAAVVEAVRPAPVKVMLELPLLTPEQRDQAVQLAVEAGVAYVKNASSGAVGAAMPADIRYLKSHVPPRVKVKGSGSIKTFERVVELLEAGADLVGTSAGVAIVTRQNATASNY